MTGVKVVLRSEVPSEGKGKKKDSSQNSTAMVFKEATDWELVANTVTIKNGETKLAQFDAKDWVGCYYTEAV